MRSSEVFSKPLEVFISYSHQDENLRVELDKHLSILQQQDIIKPWQDRKISAGTEWEGQIDDHLGRANIILLLISADFLSSKYCYDIELKRAMERHEAGEARVIPVILRACSWQNAPFGKLQALPKNGKPVTSWDNTDEALMDICHGINLVVQELTTGTWNLGSQLSFQNREPELNKILDNLKNIPVTKFWLITAASQMGKTWFLAELQKRLQATQSNLWTIQSLDIRKIPPDGRIKVSLLLSLCFSLDLNPVADITEVATIVATKIIKSGKSTLILLDSAELLENGIEKNFRAYLGAIYEELRKSGKASIRLAFVAASRRMHQAWRGIYPAPPFDELPLSHFNDNVVELVLRDMAKKDGHTDFDTPRYRDLAKRLYCITEGLPGLLVEYLQWIHNEGYVRLERIESQRNFEILVRPYVEEKLLSIGSLVPYDGDRLEAKGLVLKSTLLGLAQYRLITRPHVEHIIQKNEKIQKGLDELKWGVDDLWNAFKNTYLMYPIREPWLVIHSAIRRLLFRYQHSTCIAQAEQHLPADEFYRGWQSLAGRDEWAFLVERIWHRAEYLRLRQEQNANQKLEQFVVDLFSVYTPPKGYTRQDVSDFIQEQVFQTNDGLGMEFQETITAITDELLEKIFQVIKQPKEAKP